MFSKTFSGWVLLASLIAYPLAFYATHEWLQNFAYRVNVTPFLFLMAAGLALVASLLAVSFHIFKTATANPVDSLRYE
jgi:putative ABC transport system permease protein